MDEIARRQNAAVLGKDNVNRALFNALLLFSTFVIPGIAYG